MLDSHPSVEAYPELFDPREEHPFFFAAYVRAHSAHGSLGRARACFAYLNEIYVPGSELEAVGFKLMYGQARRNAAVVAYLLARRVRIVHLMRSNLLDIVVSRELADTRGRFHSSELYPSPEPDASPVSVYLDPSTIAARLGAIDRQVHAVRRLLRLARSPSIEVAYENLVADRDGFRVILRFLGVEDASCSLSSGTRKVNPFGKRQTIANYDEIRVALSSTRFAPFLD
jgi:hypothetical protein